MGFTPLSGRCLRFASDGTLLSCRSTLSIKFLCIFSIPIAPDGDQSSYGEHQSLLSDPQNCSSLIDRSPCLSLPWQVAEKPSIALSIATALSGGRVSLWLRYCPENRVIYYPFHAFGSVTSFSWKSRLLRCIWERVRELELRIVKIEF